MKTPKAIPVAIEGRKFYCAVTGSGDSPLLLLHGNNSALLQLRGFLKPMPGC